MLWAFASMLLWAFSVVFATRAARMLGGTEANFWRLTLATFFLSLWAYGFGQGLAGSSFHWFFWSGVIGIGIGDFALFQGLTRIGSRLTVLLLQCLSAPFAAVIEYVWLGTRLSVEQMLCGAAILAGVSLAISPAHITANRRVLFAGTGFAILAALGNAGGAVLVRKGFLLAEANDEKLDGGTAAFQRLVGGLLVAGLILLLAKHNRMDPINHAGIREKWRKAWTWVLANAIAGQTLGVTCYQLALKSAATGVVLPITALTPLAVMPLAHHFENERLTVRAIVGGVLAVTGAIGLILARQSQT